MIANITHTELVKPLIEYNENKVNKGVAERLDFNSFDPNSNKDSVINQLAILSNYSKRKDKNMHISLNFQKEDFDILGKDKLVEIADNYLNKLGFPEDHLRAIYYHFDTNNPHIHIVTSKIVNGKALNDSNLFRRSQAITRELELEYNLTKISSKKTYKKLIIPADLAINNAENIPNLTERYRNITSFVLENYKVTSLQEYNLFLEQFGVKSVLVEGINREKEYKGLVYVDLYDSLKPVKSTAISQNAKLESLEKKFAYNSKYVDNRKDFINKSINSILYEKYNLITINKLKEELLKIGIETEFISKNGIVSGWRFNDFVTGKVYKASDINRNLSFSKISNRVGDYNKRNNRYYNQMYFNVLQTEYKKKFNDVKDQQHWIMYMAANGMIPVVKNNEVFFNYYKNSKCKFEDYSKGSKVVLNKIDTNKISNLINSNRYKYIVLENRSRNFGNIELANRVSKYGISNRKSFSSILLRETLKFINPNLTKILNTYEENKRKQLIIKNRIIKENKNKLKI